MSQKLEGTWLSQVENEDGTGYTSERYDFFLSESGDNTFSYQGLYYFDTDYEGYTISGLLQCRFSGIWDVSLGFIDMDVARSTVSCDMDPNSINIRDNKYATMDELYGLLSYEFEDALLGALGMGGLSSKSDIRKKFTREMLPAMKESLLSSLEETDYHFEYYVEDIKDYDLVLSDGDDVLTRFDRYVPSAEKSYISDPAIRLLLQTNAFEEKVLGVIPDLDKRIEALIGKQNIDAIRRLSGRKGIFDAYYNEGTTDYVFSTMWEDRDDDSYGYSISFSLDNLTQDITISCSISDKSGERSFSEKERDAV